MTQHDIEPDRTALKSEFSTDPSDHGADGMEFLESEMDYGGMTEEPNEFGYYGFKMTFTDISLVRLWSEDGDSEVVRLIDDE